MYLLLLLYNSIFIHNQFSVFCKNFHFELKNIFLKNQLPLIIVSNIQLIDWGWGWKLNNEVRQLKGLRSSGLNIKIPWVKMFVTSTHWLLI